MCPAAISPGAGTSLSNESDMMLLPEPDSPTMASVSPAPTAKSTASTAITLPAAVLKQTRSPRTSITGVSVVIGAISDP